jgi:hypothetical protein
VNRAAHWVVAILPFVAVLLLSIYGFGRYAWLPFVAGILCPAGAVLIGMAVRNDRRAERGLK